MLGFLGRFDYSVDSKGRLNIPAKFRKCLSPEADETFVVVPAPNGCLRAFPQNEWAAEEETLTRLPQTLENLRFIRKIRDAASDSHLDGQGRIMLNKTQLDASGIKESVVLVGSNRFVEIWDTERYNSYRGDNWQSEFDELYQKTIESSLGRQ
jgi:MraZ protein